MKTTLKCVPLPVLALLLAIGCSGGGGGSAASQPGVLEPGGNGVSIGQVDDGTGTPVNARFSSAVDINDSLQVIGFAEVNAGSPFTAALWTVDAAGASVSPRALAPLAVGGFASAFAIDEAGSPVGQADEGTTRLVAVIWKNGLGAPSPLPELDPAGNYAAYAISAEGNVIAGQAVDNLGISRAVVWLANGDGTFASPPIALPVNVFSTGAGPSFFSAGNGVARVGATEILVAGEVEDGDGVSHAALWRSADGGSTFTPVDLGANHVAFTVNSQRLVAGEASDTLTPVSWIVSDLGVAATPVVLAATGSALAVNENNRIAGISGASDRATVWNGTTASPLFNSLSQAYGINNAAQPLVVGRNGSAGFVKRAD